MFAIINKILDWFKSLFWKEGTWNHPYLRINWFYVFWLFDINNFSFFSALFHRNGIDISRIAIFWWVNYSKLATIDH